MKKIAALLAIGVLAACGLVATSTPAQATCTSDQYQGCIRTTTKLSAPSSVKPGKTLTARVRVATSGNAQPQGQVTLVTTGPGGFKKTDKVTIDDSNFVSITVAKLKKPGKYKLKATFKGGDGFRDSSATDTVTVKKQKE